MPTSTLISRPATTAVVASSAAATAKKESIFERRLPPGREWFSVRTIASAFGFSINHVNNLIDSGAIPLAIDARTPGSSKAMRRIHRMDLIAFLEKQQENALPVTTKR